jgi:catechol 2,3-dioxygenase-like lactoylglutathione lyase family enzyme
MKSIMFIVAFVIVGLNGISQARKVEAIGITVSDMETSLRFYTEVLQFQKISDEEVYGPYWEKLFGVFGAHLRIARLQLGEETIELVDYLTTGGRSIPEFTSSNDLSFQHIAIVVSNMDSAYRILRKFNISHVSTSPQTLPLSIPEAAGIRAFYFQDPDRHNLEIIYFPKGKGQEKWQKKTNKIFLGIDHTAIGVSKTEQSHQFYQGMIGFEKKGESWNKGSEQEHLNNVEGASLHITGYRSMAGPGVEFLEYIIPGPGRKYPSDTRSDDIWNWYTIVYVDNATSLYTQFKNSSSWLVSRELVEIKLNGSIIQRSFIVRDPDGHAILIREEKINRVIVG